MEKTCKTCYHYYHNKHTHTICRHALMCDKHNKWEPYTNGDWLRTANDEELAEFLCNIVHHGCKHCIADGVCKSTSIGFNNWLEIRKEIEDESR